eukprot:m.309390 g.309390  ORF g.309390 m.309390 type:complete len:139 (-) comp23034_c1_seq1:47-463(-)
MNYKGLVTLQNKYAGKAFKILAFPCNQFGSQEPDSNAAIEHFARNNYTFTEPMFAKSTVNPPQCTGNSTVQCTSASKLCCPINNPVFEYLTSVPATSGKIPWNFEKFLVGKDGIPVKRSSAISNPDKFDSEIAQLLGM